MFCSRCRSKSTKKRQHQGDDDKIKEMYMVRIKRRWATVPQHAMMEFRT
jgi:hypothetical protein